MGLPTLLKPGHLIPAMGERQEDLDKIKPIDYILEWFRNKISTAPRDVSDRIVVANSTTGSGKSTVMPTEIYLEFGDVIKNVIVTQPRVVTAMDIPKTIVGVPVYTHRLKMGENIGYQTGNYKMMGGSGILFCTVGILLQYLVNNTPEEFCKKWKLIVLDEAHDRSIAMDTCFMYLKLLLTKVPLDQYPFLILTSGTMDIARYTSYFGTKTVFNIKGDSYPIETIYSDVDVPKDYITEVNAIITKIHQTTETNAKTDDIVVFMPTTSSITKAKKAADGSKGIMGLSLDSKTLRTINKEYMRIFEPIQAGEDANRKVLIGTNAIETGITLPSVKYCVDSGLVNSMEYDPVHDMSVIYVKPATQSMILQRRGRVGRIMPGIFMPAYTQKLFSKLQPMQYPELLTSDLYSFIANFVETENISAYDVYKKLNVMDIVPRIAVSNALHRMHLAGYLNSKGEVPSTAKIAMSVQKKMNTLPWHVTRFIMIAITYGIHSLDVATMAAYLTIGKKSLVMIGFKSFYPIMSDQEDPKDLAYMTGIIKTLTGGSGLVDFMLAFYSIREKMSDRRFDIRQYLESHKVSYDGISSLITLRDEILMDMMASEVAVSTPRINLYDSYTLALKEMWGDSLDGLINAVKTIKRCVQLSLKKLERDSGIYRPAGDYIGLTISSKNKRLWIDSMLASKGVDGSFKTGVSEVL